MSQPDKGLEEKWDQARRQWDAAMRNLQREQDRLRQVLRHNHGDEDEKGNSNGQH